MRSGFSLKRRAGGRRGFIAHNVCYGIATSPYFRLRIRNVGRISQSRVFAGNSRSRSEGVDVIYSEVGKSCAVVDQVNTPAVTNTPAQEFVPSPPSESARQAQASAERPSNGAGGASRPKPDACERCKRKYTADGHVKPVHWARRSQMWLCLWCVFEMPENK